MLKNYFNIAWRNLLKHKIFSIINLAGLSLSVTLCLLLYFFIRQEQSYDAFHQKKDHLFRLEMTDPWKMKEPPAKKTLLSFLTSNDDGRNSIVLPLVVGPDIKQVFPEVKSVTRFEKLSHHFGSSLVKVNQQVFKEDKLYYADDNFFSNFSFPLRKGNPQNALSSTQQVVISQATAKKYFDDQDPIGKTIELIGDSNRFFTVSGVADDAPVNSSIRFSLVLPLQADPQYKQNIKGRFNDAFHITMIELADGVDQQAFEQKLNAWMKTYFSDYLKTIQDQLKGSENAFHWTLRPLADCHYYRSYEWDHYTDTKNLYQLACLTIVILTIAALNYILLTISNAASRLKEIVTRKVMGAARKSIVLQYWVETQILVVLATGIGLLLCQALLPLFNYTLDANVSIGALSWKRVLPDLVCACLLLGLIAGYYPAVFLSKVKPVSVLNGFHTFRINPRFSRILVVLQYTFCVIFIISALVISLQMHYVNHKDLGFDKDEVIMVNNPVYDPVFTKAIRERLYHFASTQPYIKTASGMNGGLDGSSNTSGFVLNGEQVRYRSLSVDYNYFSMLGLPIIKGRAFSRDIKTDTARAKRAAVINETLFKMLGNTAKVGEYNETLDKTIIGVVKDYHVESLSAKIGPAAHTLIGNYTGRYMFKVNAGHMREALSRLEKEWKDVTGNYPFEYTFLDQSIANMYKDQVRWEKTIQYTCFFAILIACFGLFGLSAINAANRTKEIGIRKVLGASVADIVGSLSKSFLAMISIAVCIAIPVAWWLMNRWLEDFAYRIHLSWWIFAIAAIGALLTAFIATGYQSVRAATANPAKTLKEM